MRRDVVRVHPETNVETLDKVLSEQRISGVPVVDGDLNVVGIVSQTDIVRRMSKDDDRSGGFYDGPSGYRKTRATVPRELSQTRVSEIMERRIHSVAPQDPISRAAAMMNRLRIHRLLVVDRGRMVGILSSFDLVKILENVDFFEEYYGLSGAKRENAAGTEPKSKPA